MTHVLTRSTNPLLQQFVYAYQAQPMHQGKRSIFGRLRQGDERATTAQCQKSD